MRVQLSHLITQHAGEVQRREERLDVEALRVGRGADCELRIPGDEVPLHHSVLRASERSIRLDGVEATSILVNGRAVSGAHLQAGDAIRIGEYEIRVVEPPPDVDLALDIEQVESAAAALKELTRRSRLTIERRLFTRRKLSWLAVATVVALFVALPFAARRPGIEPSSPVAVAGRRMLETWSSGPLSPVHQNLPGGCAACHAQSFEPVRDEECRRCHEAPVHSAIQRTEPRCGSCHVEHQGDVTLAAVAIGECTACHANLPAAATKELRLVGDDGRAITGFHSGHPEFAVWTDVERTARTRLDAAPPPLDPSDLQFDHDEHLQAGLAGPPGTRSIDIRCGDCHQDPFVAAAWRTGGTWKWIAGPGGGPEHMLRDWQGVLPADLAPAEEPAYFSPIRYDLHCATCHPHTFDPRLPDAPHDSPVVVREFLQGAFERLALNDPSSYEGYRSAKEWVRESVEQAEDFLYGPCGDDEDNCTRCQTCHTVRASSGEDPPVIVPPGLPERWLPHARFDHGVHRLLACAECHAGVRESKESSDILLPEVATCRRCHTADDAGAECATCHTYHGTGAPVTMEGKRTIEELSASSDDGGT